MERLRSHHAAQSSPRRYRRPGPGQRGSQTGVSHLTSMHHMDTRSERLQRQNGQLASLPTQEGVSDPFRDGGVQAIRVGPETGRFGHRRGRGHHRGHHGGHHGGHHRGGG
ncbi:hypothetical protein BaRGS_00002824 [Batillaria attramentaria]|uniref:Uncharacterized protein n=1 Tax=Batillaria attramentaria TaxID=370345 RepID=A0ABD0M339_9CAEN